MPRLRGLVVGPLLLLVLRIFKHRPKRTTNDTTDITKTNSTNGDKTAIYITPTDTTHNNTMNTSTITTTTNINITPIDMM